ncbi:translocation/assembly module TamB domain-containing protein [Desulfatibacillum aliphaticivorans]|uniref:translocation/assembly module TamB domain-containing protein n=1 Tax=Desulfatibacillum aliphaticivorans TaxID=218208 RepID=UPI000422C540|nr:translocation/assembly module TamB domain-containing protein [Desulfatibacillum aliphaticivorans]
MKRIFKILLWALLVFLIFGFIVVPLALRTDFVQERLTQYAENATKDLPVSISFSRIMPDVLSRVTVEGLKISAQNEVIFRAESVTVGPLLPGVLGEEITLGHVIVDNPTANLVRNPDGSWNAASWFPPSENTEDEEPFNLTQFPVSISRAEIKNGRIQVRVHGEDGAVLMDKPFQLDLKGRLKPFAAVVNNLTLREAGKDNADFLTCKGVYDLKDDAETQVQIKGESPSLAQWRALAPGLPDLENLKISLTAHGPLDKPEFTYALKCDPEQTVEGAASLDLSGPEFAMKANAAVGGLILDDLAPEVPGQASGKIKASMTGMWPDSDIKAEVIIQPSQVLSYAVSKGRISLDYNRSGDADLSLSSQVNLAELKLTANGNAKGLLDQDAPLSVQFHADVLNADPRKLAMETQAPSGDLNFTLNGQADKAAGQSLGETLLTFNAGFSPSRLEKLEINSASINGVLDNRGVEVRSANVQGHGMELNLSGKVDYEAQGLAKAKAKISDLAGLTSLFLKQPIPGAANLSLTAKGDLADPDLQGEVTAELPDLAGVSEQFLKSAVKGSAKVNLKAKGKWKNPTIDGRVQLALPDLSGLAAPYLEDPLKGAADVDLFAKGPALNPALSGEISMRGVKYLDYAFDQGNFKVKAAIEPMAVSVQGGVKALNLAGQTLDSLALDVDLEQNDLTFTLNGKGGAADSINAKGVLAGYRQLKKKLTLSSLESVYQGKRAALVKPAVLEIAPDSVKTSGLELVCEEQTLSVQGGYWFNGNLDASVSLPQADLYRLSEILQLSRPFNGAGDAFLAAKGSLEKPEVRFEVNAQEVSIDKDLPGLSLRATGVYEKGLASVSADLVPETGGKLEFNSTCPMELGLPLKDDFLPRSGLQASIKGQGLDLAFLPQWVDGLDVLEGVLNLEAAASGDPRSPILHGSASMAADNMVVEEWQDPITDLKAQLEWTPQLVSIKDLSARTQKEGELHGSGTVALDNFKPTDFNLALQTRKFDLSYWGMITARADSDLKLVGMWPDIDLTGQVKVGKGEFRLDRFMAEMRRKVAVEKDVRIVGEEVEEKESPIKPMGLNLDVSIEGPMWIRGEGAQIQAGGDLNVTKERQSDAIRTRGYLETKRGVYEFRGKNFDVEKGRVDFVGLYPPDPILEIVAAYKVAGVTIYLEIGGTPSSMIITLSADPELDQTDIASLLIFGKRASDLSSGESKSLEEQGAAMLAAKALDEFKQIVGADVPVDMLSVRSNGEGNGGQDLVVGKYLSPKLFVTYRRGISSESANEVQLQYQLTPKISVESQISQSESGVDLFWNYDY